MKLKLKKNKVLLAAGLSLTGLTILSCSKDFLERPPYGAISDADLANRTGVEGLLVGAYSMLDGSGYNDWLIDAHNTTVWNTWFGSVGADDAHKGSISGAQTYRAQIENKTYTPSNEAFYQKWKFLYGAIGRTNETIRMLAKTTGIFSDAEATQIIAQARCLRGIYHFEAAKIWNNIPFIDETIEASANNFKVPNTQDPQTWPEVWANIEADFQFAIDNLPPTQAQVGRVNSWVAKAFLAKTYMQQAKLAEALPVLTDIIDNGLSVKGAKLDLMPKFFDLFRSETENGVESLFDVQMSVNEQASQGANGNDGVNFNYPPWIGVAGWGHQPSFNLVNAFKTQGGLPMLDNFNDVNVKHNYPLAPTDPFVPEVGTLDPRLDWTVGRRGLPYHDWGIMNQAPHIDGGPYWGKKWVIFKSEPAQQKVDGWKMQSGINFPMVRFADILLMAAEAEIEVGDPEKARGYVNRVRARAANPAGMLKRYNNDADPSQGFSAVNAANYDIQQYPGGSFGDKAYARKATRFERRLEFATEGHRFFDLQRFDRIDKKFGGAANYMAGVLNAYMQSEPLKYEAVLPAGQTYSILKGATFTAGKHEVYPIPQDEIERSRVGNDQQATLKQNPGFE